MNLSQGITKKCGALAKLNSSMQTQPTKRPQKPSHPERSDAPFRGVLFWAKTRHFPPAKL
jgi:hypothetical protein